MLQPDIASAQGGHVQGKQRRLTEERLPPYLSYRVWLRLLNDRMSAHNPPSRFDSSYFDELKITKSCRSMLKGTLMVFGLDVYRRHSYTPDYISWSSLMVVAIRLENIEPTFCGMPTDPWFFFGRNASYPGTGEGVLQFPGGKQGSGNQCRKCLSFFFAVCAEGNIPLFQELRKSAPRGKRGKRV